ncbi:MAG: UPF0755 protein [Parcubacteria bacterium C7867-001]|nr:MAG: UPF0755 protein [Parcubacteria bacterium C7867-001]
MDIDPRLALISAIIEFHVARLRTFYISFFLALAVVAAALWYTLLVPPAQFPTGNIITVPKDETLYMIATELANEHVITSPRLFLAVARVLGGDTQIQAGRYLFAEPSGLFTVVWRLINHETGIIPVRVRLVEGMTARDMADTLKKQLPGFDEAAFLAEAVPLEGHLFPDTYELYPGTTSHEIVVMLYANFETQLATIEDKVKAFNKPLPDIITMASLIEREGRGLKEKQMISGVLWNRIKKGIPLQVDAVFGYINNRQTYSPSFADLKIDSPYNTYTNKGLPPGAIANPGIDSLLAAVTPATTTALYYLTGRDGRMYYAKTFAEHKRNRALYLD